MSLRPPGSRSNVTLLISSLWTILSLLLLIGGHLVLALFVYSEVVHQSGMEHIARFSGIEPPYLWGSIGIALALDAWIFVSSKRDRQKKIRR